MVAKVSTVSPMLVTQYHPMLLHFMQPAPLRLYELPPLRRALSLSCVRPSNSSWDTPVRNARPLEPPRHNLILVTTFGHMNLDRLPRPKRTPSASMHSLVCQKRSSPLLPPRPANRWRTVCQRFSRRTFWMPTNGVLLALRKLAAARPWGAVPSPLQPLFGS